MNAETCLRKLREIKSVSFATVDQEGKPQVRIIDVMLVENGCLYFLTARGKDFYHELQQSQHIAVVGLSREYEMIRLNGIVKKLDQQKLWIDRMFQENPSMQDVYPSDSRYILEPFCIERCEIEYFDLSKTPIYRKSYSMHEYEIKQKGFIISDACIQCGLCASKCPQHCIEKGSPFHILQEHCLHCGLCYENCPVQAIHHRNPI